jgi:hypothetical protein
MEMDDVFDVLIFSLFGLLFLYVIAMGLGSIGLKGKCMDFCTSNGMGYYAFLQSPDTKLSQCGCCITSKKIIWNEYKAITVCNSANAEFYGMYKKGD